jgi:hypothetical protein
MVMNQRSSGSSCDSPGQTENSDFSLISANLGCQVYPDTRVIPLIRDAAESTETQTEGAYEFSRTIDAEEAIPL